MSSHASTKRIFQYALLAALLAVFGLFLIYPIWLTVKGGFQEPDAQGGFTLRHLKLIFMDPVLLAGLKNAFLIAVGTTTLSLVIALPLAVLSAKYRYPGKGLWNSIILVPLILPPFVGAIGLQAIMGREGTINTLLGTNIDFLGNQATKFWMVVLVQALHLYPIIYLNATAALANLDPALDEAAENLGIGPWKRFFRITLPLIRPGLFAGATIVFIWAFTELGTPLMLNFYTVTPVQIFSGIKEVSTSAQPYALTVVMLVAAIGMYVLGKLVFGGKAYAMYAKASRAGEETQLTGGAGLFAAAMFALVTAAALIPHIGVVLASFSAEGAWYRSVIPTEFTTHNFEQALGHPLAFGSIVNSLKYASIAVIADIVLGILIGYIIVRTKIKGRMLLDSLAMLPLAVPGLVMAFGFVALSIELESMPPIFGVKLFGEDALINISIIGSMPNPIILLVIAYSIRRLPYVVRATVAGLEQTSGELEEAAVNLGASTFTAVRKIIVPLIAANLIAGGLLAFSFAMLEVSDSLILAQQEGDYPITKAIYAFSERLGDGHGIASAMGVWGMALLTVTLVGASVMLGKKLGAIFRV
ncbi:MAG: ABC transporter permease [Phycisphaerales bacterium JB065]